MVVKYQLESLGLSADFVNNGREAVQASGEHPYDLILMDCHMPEMSGYEATREIRRRQEGTGKHIPIVAMTAGALAGDREKCLQAGMDDYISKPVDATTLGTLLASWLRDREVDDPARGDPGDAAPIDFEALEDTYGAPNAASLARLFEEDASREITLLEQAVKQHDLAGVAAHAHGLRGLCGAICSPSMIAQCDRLRQAKILEDWGAIAALTRSLGTELRRAHDLLRERYP
jgi:CheY-like chemotaxis protein